MEEVKKETSPFEKQVLVTVSGRSGDDAPLVLTTKGTYRRRGGISRIQYRETELTGFSGNPLTTLTVDGERMVTVARDGGEGSTFLKMEKYRRNECMYQTPYGPINFGVYATEISSKLDGNGGTLHFSYRLDIAGKTQTENDVLITVKECLSHAES